MRRLDKVMKLIPLNHGKFAKVDNEDYEIISLHKWSAHKNYKDTFYATRTKKKLYMHRIILGLKKSDKKIVDHINGNGLDNRKINLRITTNRINQQNRHIHRKGKVVGANRRPNGKYESRIWDNGKLKSLGVFSTAIEASKVYKEYANAI